MDAAHPDRFRCWLFKQYHQSHGPLTGPQAIENSCNIFFYTMGQRLGVQARHRPVVSDLRPGAPLGCGLEDEVGGSLPNLAWLPLKIWARATPDSWALGKDPSTGRRFVSPTLMPPSLAAGSS